MSHCPKVQKWQFFQEFLQICRKKREGLTFWKRKVAAPSGTVRHGPAPSGCPPARSACHTAPSGGHPAASRGHPAPCRWHLAPSRGHPLQYGGCPAPYRGRLASYGGCLAPSEVLWPSPEGTELTLGLPRSSILGFFYLNEGSHLMDHRIQARTLWVRTCNCFKGLQELQLL